MNLYALADCHVSPIAQIGKDNKFGIQSIVADNVIIGNNNIIAPNAVIGTAGEIYGNKQVAEGSVIIGDNNDIREFSGIQASKSGETTICNNCILMRNSHIAHDCFVGNNAHIAVNAVLGGYVRIGSHSRVGLNASVNPRLVVGDGVIIGSGAVVTHHIPPYLVVAGNPAKILKFNRKFFEINTLYPSEIVEDAENKYLNFIEDFDISSNSQFSHSNNPILSAMADFLTSLQSFSFIKSNRIIR